MRDADDCSLQTTLGPRPRKHTQSSVTNHFVIMDLPVYYTRAEFIETAGNTSVLVVSSSLPAYIPLFVPSRTRATKSLDALPSPVLRTSFWVEKQSYQAGLSYVETSAGREQDMLLLFLLADIVS